MENNLIEIKSYNGVNSVSARELFTNLGYIETSTKFTEWIQMQLGLVDAVENEDFSLIRFKTNYPGERFKVDYMLTLDVAKEICMVVGVLPRTNNETKKISKAIRRYFIECEKQLTAVEGDCLAHAGRIAGDESNALEYVAKWNVLRRHRCLTVEQVDAICRLLPLYPAINYIEIAKAVGTSIDTLRSVRKQIDIMKEA